MAIKWYNLLVLGASNHINQNFIIDDIFRHQSTIFMSTKN